MFNLLCFLTGQYITSKEITNQTKICRTSLILIICSIILTLSSSIINLASTAFNISIIWKCPFKYCGYIDVYVNTTDKSELLSLQPDKLYIFDDFQKFVFTSASISGTLSYFFFIYVVYTQNRFKCKKRNNSYFNYFDNIQDQDSNYRLETEGIIKLDPFIWYNPNKDHTLLMCTQLISFYVLLLLNIFIFFVSVIIFFFLFSARYNHSDTTYRLFYDIGGLCSQFYSWYCSILSCFIFSKVAYAARNLNVYKLFPCLNQVADLGITGNEAENEANSVADAVNEKLNCFSSEKAKQDFISYIKRKEVTYLNVLSSVDKLYCYILKDSLQPYGSWFAIHWLMYTLTAFLSVSYVIQAVLIELYGDNEICHGEHNLKCRLKLAYIFLFSLNHCLLFLYPCFRAASVTSTRYGLIKRVSEAYWPSVPLEQKQAFIQYLKDENCTFKVSILCAQINFGFNITFFSIFIGIMGVVLKLSL